VADLISTTQAVLISTVRRLVRAAGAAVDLAAGLALGLSVIASALLIGADRGLVWTLLVYVARAAGVRSGFAEAGRVGAATVVAVLFGLLALFVVFFGVFRFLSWRSDGCNGARASKLGCITLVSLFFLFFGGDSVAA
jgi:uncharacterized membrane protein